MPATRMWLWLLLSSLCVASHLQGADFQWQSALPESQGMSSDKIAQWKAAIEKSTRALLVARNDRIVLEWYSDGQSAAKKQGTASLAKAIVGGLSLAVAMDDGRIALDDPATKFVPQWQRDPLKSKITVRHLGSHTSGIDDSHNRDEQARGIDQGKYTGWTGDFWRWRGGTQRPPKDAFTIARDAAPILFDPGSDFQYSNPGIAMLSYCVTASLRDGPQRDVRSLLRERVMRPIGVADSDWSCGYGLTEEIEGLPIVANWGGGSYTPRAAARLGRLVLRRGDWEGKQILSESAVQQVTGDAGLPGHCGMGWWTNADGRMTGVPKDAVWGAGAGHQILLVVPSENLILVRNGSDLFPRSDDRDRLGEILFQPLLAAIVNSAEHGMSSSPVPPSPVIKGIEWAPRDEIVRAARGSDNWPMTWADDDHQYTAYGDGWGFEPLLKTKLSMGFARVERGPLDYQGFNVRSPTGETLGQGPQGKKASGMLMVDGVLYLLIRNAENSQLGWSEDHGRSWSWSDWKFTTSFGCPTFLNFGRNYRGARDEFVYVYSLDSPTAYDPADRMVMARVPKDRLRDQAAYEFFVRLDDAGRPVWTRELDRRGAVFTHPGRCYRTGISYHPSTRRYLWCHIFPESTHRDGPRFQGGLGVFDAPEPWGPWTTVYFVNDWDVGPGETCSFPTKWMSDDGVTLHLVFSGDDQFSVRRARLLRP